MTSRVNLTEVIAPSFYDVHWDIHDGEHTEYWLSGGRGSTKSSFISIELILGIMQDPNANAVVLRKVKDTLRESVMDQLQWAIMALGVEEYWDIPEAKLVITYKPTGQEIRFRGADKPKRIKGLKYAEAIVNIFGMKSSTSLPAWRKYGRLTNRSSVVVLNLWCSTRTIRQRVRTIG
jgi:phage terminase large subunit